MNRINEIGKVNLKNKPLIQAFSGSGAIGTILSTFLINSLKMEQVAVIHSKSIAPLAIIKNGLIEHPIRLFQSEELALMSCEIPIPYGNTHAFLEMLLDYYIKQGVSHIVPVGGLPVLKSPENDANCYAIASNDETLAYLRDKGIKILNEGIIYGTIVETLEMSASKGFESSFALLAECDPGVASYYSAKQIILELSKLFDFSFDEDEFNNVSSIIQDRIEESTRLMREETADRTRESHL
jgi:uncharacterized protein